jgi:hypothetical protein
VVVDILLPDFVPAGLCPLVGQSNSADAQVKKE